MEQKDAKELLKKYRQGKATEDEKALLGDWILFGKLKDFDLTPEQLGDELSMIGEKLPLVKKRRIVKLWPRIAAAASIVLCLSVGGYFVFNHQPEKRIARAHDIAPGGNKAILTLADGSTIDLRAAKNGKLANQGDMVINKSADGQIVYASSENSASSQNTGINMATTPRGGQFQLVLADGTKVWLNAASSIKYPVVFNGKERRVELTGEAYFEVAHNKEKPFKVISNGQEVEVLGTHFNINAYNDERSVKTTLLEGSVRISSLDKNKMLKPGEQAQIENGNILIADVDVNEVVAWKNGFFQFNDDNIRDIMRQLGRWYDVDVKYEGKLPDRAFSGEISRNIKLAQLLDMLGFEKIHFRIEGKTIIVMP